MSRASQVWSFGLVLFLQVHVAPFLEAGRRTGQASAWRARGSGHGCQLWIKHSSPALLQHQPQ